MSIAVLITTHDRTDDARVNMEIVRGWDASVPIVHAVNGPPGTWQPYLEDVLLDVPAGSGHFSGAGDLLDAGLAAVRERYPAVRYVVCLASDTWWYRFDRVRQVVDEMTVRGLHLAAASWEVADHAHGVRRELGDPELLPGRGLSTDCFVIDVGWAFAHGMLPLDYEGFVARNGELLNYLQEIVLLERHFEGRFLGAVRAQLRAQGWRKDGWGSEGMRRARARVRLMDERRIVPDGHKGHWPDLGLITIEDPVRKRAELTGVPGLVGGPVLRRLLDEPDVGWFNQPGARTAG